VSVLIKFLLSFNLRFDYPHENPIMITLLSVNEQITCRELIERLILLFNRSSKKQKFNSYLIIQKIFFVKSGSN
jgi:hypothetical protein